MCKLSVMNKRPGLLCRGKWFQCVSIFVFMLIFFRTEYQICLLVEQKATGNFFRDFLTSLPGIRNIAAGVEGKKTKANLRNVPLQLDFFVSGPTHPLTSELYCRTQRQESNSGLMASNDQASLLLLASQDSSNVKIVSFLFSGFSRLKQRRQNFDISDGGVSEEVRRGKSQSTTLYFLSLLATCLGTTLEMIILQEAIFSGLAVGRHRQPFIKVRHPGCSSSPSARLPR